MGDVVTVKECRPISKSKTWVLVSDQDIKNENKVSADKDSSEESA